MSALEGYDYNPSTGTYVRNPHYRRPSHPPPLPPKEHDLVKETQHASASELEGSNGTDPDVGRLSLESQPHDYYNNNNDAVSQVSSVQKRRKVRVLSLDGGGIRGYSTLVILQELMHQIYVQENGGRPPKSPSDLPRPCDYFDLIGGNGTGGLIALMLGRMRMDVESCKNYYVELTRFVFITDKTLLGMPYGKTLFKASRLEEAIKHCVRESTRFDTEKIIPHSPPPADGPDLRFKPMHRRTDSWRRKRSASQDTTDTQSRGRTGRPLPRRRAGNSEAPLLDSRQGACKTFVTTMLEGSPKGTTPVLLRSYPSPAESVASYKTTIWQAGRATCATAAAFKPITIDQVTFLDEGAGMYNPAFQVLDEARIHEYPTCDVGAFVSVGTGKRPKSVIGTTSRKEWWEGVAFEGFAEAKRRLLRRVDDCERVHRELVDGFDGGRPRLAKSGVAAEDYYRFNAEVGVGEFGMNEWNRLADVSTGTRLYLNQRESAKFVRECASKLVAIERGAVDDGTKIRFRPGGGAARERGHTLSDASAVSPKSPQNKFPPPARPSAPPPAPIRPPAPAPLIHGPPSPPEKEVYVQSPQTYTPQSFAPYPDPDDYRSPPADHHPAYQPQPQNPYQVPPAPAPPALPTKPQKQGKVIEPANDAGFGDYGAEDMPNPEIRVTSPTTVAGGSDEEEEERRGKGRRRRRRSRSRNRVKVEGYGLEGVEE
ncbi:acyl transferase/acyl hydrolase/lysophospholipase [Geopyxis carbonaria]|nr:acyl transferase/acyl hydrolase/lysophospholipase [Geopyxis carbonaria]